MLETILSKFGISFITNILSGFFKLMDSEKAKAAGKALEQVAAQISMGEITPEQLSEANRHMEEMEKLDAAALVEINNSLRAEIASNDPYVRRMRPTFGYIMAITWAAQMLAVAYVMVFDASRASLIVESIESLSAIWAVGLSVLGVYVYKRSEEKTHRLKIH